MLKRTVTLEKPTRNVRPRSIKTMRKRSRVGSESISLFQGAGSKELKNSDFAINGYNPGNNVGPVTSVCNIPAGTGPNTMIGRRAVIKAVQLSYSINAQLSASGLLASNPPVIRVMLVYDKFPQGAVPFLTDILVTNTPESPMNLTNSNRFIVLHDERHPMGVWAENAGGTAAVSAGPLSAFGKMYKKVALPFRGPSSAGIVGIEEGAIYFYAISSYPDATDQYLVQAFFRCRFDDA